jgi:hypothetical protein
MLAMLDACPLTRKQKLLIYTSGVCPRRLTVEEFPISWVEKCLDSLTARFLKSWSGLARSANNTLFLSGKKGGLNLPLPSTMHKKLQVSRQSLWLTTSDPCVRLTAESASQKALSTCRPKFKASQEVREAVIQNPAFTRKSLTKAAKSLVSEGDDN